MASKQPAGSTAGSSNAADDAAGGESIVTVPPATLSLWKKIASIIDKRQTVKWKDVANSLKKASVYFLTSPEAKRFAEGYMRSIIDILFKNIVIRIGKEKNDCLHYALLIVVEDLRVKADPSKGECKVLDVLSAVFNEINEKDFYLIQFEAFHDFHDMRGSSALATYLTARAPTDRFPPPDLLHRLLNDICFKNFDENLCLADAVMDFFGNASEETLNRLTCDSLNMLMHDVKKIEEMAMDRPTHRRERYCDFWRGLTLQLIKSKSLPLKLFGCDQVGKMIEANDKRRPPPKSYFVTGAGCTFVNGKYMYAGPLTEDGFVRSGSKISYVRKIPYSVPEKDGGGKTLTLFRCSMGSGRKWWFLSEADDERPGTKKDIDYYVHKSKPDENAFPPSYDWKTCRAGADPPPALCASGFMTSIAWQKCNVVCQLAKWAIQNKVIELVFDDPVNLEVVAKSTELIKFLAAMCKSHEPVGAVTSSAQNGLALNTYCLKASHLSLLWKTCRRKIDDAVSVKVRQLLVSILPNDLAVMLLSYIKESLCDSTDKRHGLLQVGEFCATLATHYKIEVEAQDSANGITVAMVIPEKIREEFLKLMWEFLTHPEASSLNSYDRVKNYVISELESEPIGRVHRVRFLSLCKESLEVNAQVTEPEPESDADVVDEINALHMVKLTQFVLEACPRDHAVDLITRDDSAVPNLLFRELSAYLKRRTVTSSAPSLKKASNNSSGLDHPAALSERIKILRYAYGLSDRAKITNEQLDHLLQLCSQPSDLEALKILSDNQFDEDKDDTSVSMQAESSPVASSAHEKEALDVAAFKKYLSKTSSKLLKRKNNGKDQNRFMKRVFELKQRQIRLDELKTGLAAFEGVDEEYRNTLRARLRELIEKPIVQDDSIDESSSSSDDDLI